jgi:hypothetical protein
VTEWETLGLGRTKPVDYLRGVSEAKRCSNADTALAAAWLGWLDAATIDRKFARGPETSWPEVAD